MKQDILQPYHPVSLDREYLAAESYKRFFEKYAKLVPDFSPHQKASILEDFKYHVDFLQESLAVHNAALYIDYLRWIQVLLISRHFPPNYLSSSLAVLIDVIKKELPVDLRAEADSIIKKGKAVLQQPPAPIPSYITTENPLHAGAQSFLDALIAADRKRAWTIIAQAIASGHTARDIYLEIFQPVLQETGRLWQIGQLSIAQEHYVTGSTLLFISRFHEQIQAGGKTRRKGKTLVAGCVSDELHDVGIRMVADFFELDGWDTYFIGGNTPAQSLLEAVRDRKADVLAVSSTMATRIPVIHYLIRSLRADPKTKRVKIIVGGYPFNLIPDLWKQVGADAYAGNADEAVSTANRLSP